MDGKAVVFLREGRRCNNLIACAADGACAIRNVIYVRDCCEIVSHVIVLVPLIRCLKILHRRVQRVYLGILVSFGIRDPVGCGLPY